MTDTPQEATVPTPIPLSLFVPVPVTGDGARTLGRALATMTRARLISKDDIIKVVSVMLSAPGGPLLFHSFCSGYGEENPS